MKFKVSYFVTTLVCSAFGEEEYIKNHTWLKFYYFSERNRHNNRQIRCCFGSEKHDVSVFGGYHYGYFH